MIEEISPKYLMRLIKEIDAAIWAEYKSYKEVLNYIRKWHIVEEGYNYNDYHENFSITSKVSGEIDLNATLNSMQGDNLLRIAADLGVDTPNYIPTIASFKNEIKSDYKTAHSTFQKALKLIETDPSTSIGLANSALESIIKEILKDKRIATKINGKETLYRLGTIILKEFKLLGDDVPKEIKTIGNSLLTISQSIEKLRSEKTEFHGKTDDDSLIEKSLYAHLIVNAVTTLGLFFTSFYKLEFPQEESEISPLDEIEEDDGLPF